MPEATTRALQMALNELGFDAGKVDGLLGPRTRSAAADYLADQQDEGAAKDAALVKYKGAARKLDDIDLPRIGAQIGVGEDEIHAVIDVEAAGSGFDSKGRLSMLFEPHVFYRELGPGPERDRAVAQGLAYRSWGAKPYPSDSYPRFDAACRINEEAACRSASWGLPQMMGFNAEMVGYDSAKEMVAAFSDDEDVQLQAMIDFIVASGLDDELRRHDWAGFARGYNGPGFRKHAYHDRLNGAFLKWQDIPDTPFDQAAA